MKIKRSLIDTDILSYFFKGDKAVVQSFEQYLSHSESLHFSIITYYEVYSGLKAKKAKKQLQEFEQFAYEHTMLYLTDTSCPISADIYSHLKREGNLIDDIDLLIAGIALGNNLVLVTNNEKHFQRIDDLTVQNWKYNT